MGLFDFLKTDTERAAEDAARDSKTEGEAKGFLNMVANDITRAANQVFESKEYKDTYEGVREAFKNR